jgi:hypothetical protein
MKGPRLAELTKPRNDPAPTNNRRSKSARVNYPSLTTYLSKEDIKAIKQRALDSDLRMHDLQIEAIELMLKAHGWPPLKVKEAR